MIIKNTPKQEVFNKYYKPDIFNTSQDNSNSRQKRTLIRPNYRTLENSKEDLFNIGKEKRIKRNKYPDEPDNKTGISLSIAKKINHDKIYGSNIFSQRSSSEERRKGIKRITNSNIKSKCFDEMKNDDEYLKDQDKPTEKKIRKIN